MGRDVLVASLSDALGGGARWITLVGPPGVGKTRVAVEVAARRRQDGDRVRFFDLRDTQRDEDLVERIAAGAAYAVSSDEALLDRLSTHDPDELWVLDNCEPVLDAVGALAPRLVERGRRLRLLLTSTHQLPHQPWARADERLVHVPPLPEDERAALLLDRARARGVDASDEGWRRDAQALAVAIDGLPLAIELVAAQLDTVHPRELGAQLEARGLHTVDGLDASISSAVGRLDEPTRALAIECAVFRGGFDLEAACAVLERPVAAMTEGIGRLLRASLLARAEGPLDRARFHFLGAVQGHLEARSVDRDALRRRHLAHFAAEAMARVRLIEERDTGEHEAWLDRELDNLRAALGFAEAHGERALALALAVAMDAPLRGRGAIERSRRKIEVLIEGAPSGELRIRARMALAEAERERGHPEAAHTTAERALEEALTLGDARIEMACRRVRSLAIYASGDYERAGEELDTGLALEEAAGAPVLAARLRSNAAALD